MWVPKEVVDWFQISKDSVDALREESAALRAERDVLKDQLRGALINSDFFRAQINSLQMERAALLQRAHGISVPAPQIQRTFEPEASFDPTIFDDVGDDMARKLGLPVFGDKN